MHEPHTDAPRIEPKSVTSQYHAGAISIEESPSTGWKATYIAMGVYQ
jgi:hypothetical protein